MQQVVLLVKLADQTGMVFLELLPRLRNAYKDFKPEIWSRPSSPKAKKSVLISDIWQFGLAETLIFPHPLVLYKVFIVTAILFRDKMVTLICKEGQFLPEAKDFGVSLPKFL